MQKWIRGHVAELVIDHSIIGGACLFAGRVGRLCDFLIDGEVFTGDEVIDNGFREVVAQQRVNDRNELSKQTIVVRAASATCVSVAAALHLSTPFSEP